MSGLYQHQFPILVCAAKANTQHQFPNLDTVLVRQVPNIKKNWMNGMYQNIGRKIDQKSDLLFDTNAFKSIIISNKKSCYIR